MKPLDRFIQKLRINEAAKYKPANSRLLDIVCADGAIFLQTFNKIREGIGIGYDARRTAGCAGIFLVLISGVGDDDFQARSRA